MALPGPDGVEGHPRGLDARGAEAIHRGGGDVVETELDGDPTRHVAAVLVAGLRTADVDVVQGVRIEAVEPVQNGPDHPGRQVVGPHVVSEPFMARPIGVRAAATITAYRI